MLLDPTGYTPCANVFYECFDDTSSMGGARFLT